MKRRIKQLDSDLPIENYRLHNDSFFCVEWDKNRNQAVEYRKSAWL